MNFSQLPTPWVLAGLGGLAALLYVLQRLRIRHRPVTVVTTLFWRAAAEEAPARTFRERFRHPWAYALFLLISALLWLAFAGPEPRASEGGVFHTLVLDGSAGMAAGSRYEDARAALLRQVQGLPVGQRQVLWAGAGVRTLLNPGEHHLLLERRLAGLRPAAAPAAVEELLRELAVSGRPGRESRVTLFGDAPVRAEVLALMPGLRFARVASGARPAGDNSGITALGVAEAASGAWDRVDVFLRVEGAAAAEAERFQVTLDDVELPETSLRPAPDGGWLLPGLPAAGGLLAVRLRNDDSIPHDNTARLRLPDRPRIKVLLSPALDAGLRRVLAADPAVELTETGARVVVRRSGEEIGPGLPALEFVPAAGRPAFKVVHPASLDTAAVFTHAIRALALGEIDAMALAGETGRVVEAAAAPGPQWRIEVWQDLLSEDYNFTRSRAFPLLVSSSVRWLAGARELQPEFAAGRPLTTGALEAGLRIVDERGRVLDPPGVPFTPEQAGEYQTQSSPRPFEVSLLEPAGFAWPPDANAPSAEDAPGPPLGLPGVVWLLLAALALLVWEWWLFQTGRVP